MQGLADFAVAAAGGKVTSHSLLAALPGQELLPFWRRAASAFVPGTSPYVHPNADKVCTQATLPLPVDTPSDVFVCAGDACVLRAAME